MSRRSEAQTKIQWCPFSLYYNSMKKRETFCWRLWFFFFLNHMPIFFGQLLTEPYVLKIKTFWEKLRNQERHWYLWPYVKQVVQASFHIASKSSPFMSTLLKCLLFSFYFIHCYIFKQHGKKLCGSVYICLSVSFHFRGNWIN